MSRSRAGGQMVKYRVVLWYRREPGFQIDVTADGTAMALRAAEDYARGCGWEGKPIKFSVAPLERERYTA